MKIIFKIHIFYYLVALICIFSGLFRDFVLITSLIFIHEIGHYVGAKIYNWNVEKIVILPFGGVTIFNELINKSLKEEFIILILGPLFQIIFYFILVLLKINTHLILEYHYMLLLFNMLPIIPLDGSKLLNIILNKITSYKNSHLYSIYISLIFIILLLFIGFYKKNLMLILIILFLLLKNIKEIKEHNILFIKFLFERYNYNFKFKKKKNIKGINISMMKKDYKHLFYKDRYYSEKEVLKHFFKR